MNAIRSGPFKGCYSVTSAERTFLMWEEAWSRRNIKTSFPNRCSGIFLFESIEGWSKKQDKTSKQTSDHQTNQSGRSKRSLNMNHEPARGERDVIRFRNPTEDKRAFWRMLTSADRSMRLVSYWWLYYLYFQSPVSCTSGRVHVNIYLDFIRAYPQKW